MRLKRVADRSGPEPPRNVRPELEEGELGELPDPTRPEGALLEPWPLDHVEVLSAPDGQKLSPHFVEGALGEGWLEITGTGVGDLITILAEPEPVRYRIAKVPGRYCSHCGDKLDDDPRGELARIHVASRHAGESSPDPENPAGYRCDNFFACELEG